MRVFRLLAVVLVVVSLTGVLRAETDQSKLNVEKELPASVVFRHNVNVSAGAEVVNQPAEARVVPLPRQREIDIAPVLRWYNVRAVTSQAVAVSLPQPVRQEQKRSSGTVAKTASQPSVKQTAFSGRVRGYCWFDRDYRVSVEQYVVLPCVLSAVSGNLPVKTMRAALRAKLVPAYSRFALLIEPTELEDLTNGVIYRVTTKVIYDPATGSVNVADEVNRQLIRKVLAYAAITGLKDAKSAYHEYAANRYTAKIYNSDGELVAQENRIPASYPVTTGLVSASTALFEGIINAFKSKWEKFPAIFVVKAGKKVYLDARIEQQK